MNNYGSVLYMVALVAIFYFMIIRPQQQRQKKHQATVSSLQPNANVTTYAGILGKVVSVKDDTIILKIAENVNVEILKSAVAQINNEEK